MSEFRQEIIDTVNQTGEHSFPKVRVNEEFGISVDTVLDYLTTIEIDKITGRRITTPRKKPTNALDEFCKENGFHYETCEATESYIFRRNTPTGINWRTFPGRN